MLQGLFTARDTLRRVWRTACVCASGRKGERERNEEKVGGEVGGGLQFSGCRASSIYPGPGTLTFKKGFVGL